MAKVPRPYNSWGEVYEIVKKNHPELLKKDKNLIHLSIITETNKNATQLLKVETLRKYLFS